MNTVALVTLYHPQNKTVENIQVLAKQAETVILSDNTPDGENAKMFSNIENIIYMANKANLGLSAAFNRCFALDIVRKSDFIIFFDQDSLAPDGLVSTLIHDYEILEQKYKIGCIGPARFDTHRNKMNDLPKKRISVENNCYAVDELITSSMLTTYTTIKSIGFWNEDIFLDYADYDLCWRLQSAGYQVFLTRNTMLIHTVGIGSMKISLPIINKKLTLMYSAPFRTYYQTREFVKLISKKYVPKYRKKSLTINLILHIYMDFVFLPQKGIRIKYFLKGFCDGLLCKNGELRQTGQK